MNPSWVQDLLWLRHPDNKLSGPPRHPADDGRARSRPVCLSLPTWTCPPGYTWSGYLKHGCCVLLWSLVTFKIPALSFHLGDEGTVSMKEAIESYIKRVRELAEHVRGNEQATKQSLIGPLFTSLGYDLTDPRECTPEYRADFGKD